MLLFDILDMIWLWMRGTDLIWDPPDKLGRHSGCRNYTEPGSDLFHGLVILRRDQPVSAELVSNQPVSAELVSDQPVSASTVICSRIRSHAKPCGNKRPELWEAGLPKLWDHIRGPCDKNTNHLMGSRWVFFVVLPYFGRGHGNKSVQVSSVSLKKQKWAFKMVLLGNNGWRRVKPGELQPQKGDWTVQHVHRASDPLYTGHRHWFTPAVWAAHRHTGCIWQRW